MNIVTTSNNSCKTFSNFFASGLTKQANDAVLTFTQKGTWNRCLNAWKAPSPAEHLLPAVSHEAVREYAAGAGAVIAQAIADGKVNSWRGPDGTLPSPDAPKPARRNSKKSKTASKPQHVVAIPPARTDAQVIQAVSVPAEKPEVSPYADEWLITRWPDILTATAVAIGQPLRYDALSQSYITEAYGYTIRIKAKIGKDGKPLPEKPFTAGQHKLLCKAFSDLTDDPTGEITFSHSSYYRLTRRFIPAKSALDLIPAKRKPGRPKKAARKPTTGDSKSNRDKALMIDRAGADKLSRTSYGVDAAASMQIFKHFYFDRGIAHAALDDKFRTEAFLKGGMNAYSKQLLRIDERHTLAYQIGVAINQRSNITSAQRTGVYNRIGNDDLTGHTLLSRARTGGRRAHGWQYLIKEQKENALEYLVQLGFLDDWSYRKRGDRLLTDEEADFLTLADYNKVMTGYQVHHLIFWTKRQNTLDENIAKAKRRETRAKNKVLREAAEKAARAKLNGIPQDSAVIVPQQGGVAIPPPSSSGVVIPPARPQAVPQAVSANPQQEPQVAIPPSSGVAIPPSAPQAVMAEKHVSEVRTSSPRDFVMKETFEPGEADYIADCLRQYEKNPSFCLCRENLFITFCGLQSKGYRPATIRDWLYHAGLTHCAEAADREIKTIAAYPDYDVFADIPEPQVPLPSLTAA